MSTRTQIAFYNKDEAKLRDFNVLLYRHSDGYPSAVLPEIMPFLEWWGKGRGIGDWEYCSARFMQYLTNKYDKNTLDYSQAFPMPMKEAEDIQKGFTGNLGYGICKGFHGDIEFVYAIKPKSVEVYEVHFDYGSDKTIDQRTSLIGTIPYSDYESNSDYKELIKG